MSRIQYKQDYVSYWNSKGEYGEERVRRMRARKKKRAQKLIYNCPRCKYGRRTAPHTCPFQCDMNNDYTSLCTCCQDCESGCAGDI